jgi:hypothetical protein
MANKAAAAKAQTTANQGVTAAGVAQVSAKQAQTSANQAASTAQAVGDVAVMDAAAIQLVNKRVSDLMTTRLWPRPGSISIAEKQI